MFMERVYTVSTSPNTIHIVHSQNGYCTVRKSFDKKTAMGKKKKMTPKNKKMGSKQKEKKNLKQGQKKTVGSAGLFSSTECIH